MNYTDLFEHIHSGPGSLSRFNALDPATRKAWMVLGVFTGRRGFDQWWDEIASSIRNEIFEEIVKESGKP